MPSPYLQPQGQGIIRRWPGQVERHAHFGLRAIGEQRGAGLCVDTANEALIGLGERPATLQEEDG